MIQKLVRYLVFFLVAGTLVYAGYRMLTPATTKTVAAEKSEKEEHSDSVVMSDAKVAVAEIELANAAPAVLHDSLLLNGMVQANQESLVQVTPRFPASFERFASELATTSKKATSLPSSKAIKA